MATGLCGSRQIPTAPAITGSDDHGASFLVTCDDLDGHDSDAEASTFHHLTPDRKPSFLHPESANTLRPPTPQSSSPIMSSDDGPAGPAAPALKNPFNFQTQIISTSPVKSVRRETIESSDALRAPCSFAQLTPSRASVSVAVIATNTARSARNITSSKSPRRGHHLSSPPPSRSPPSKKLGRACNATSARGSTGAAVMPPSPYTSSSAPRALSP